MTTSNGVFVLAGHAIAAGTRQSIDLPLPTLYTHTSVTMPVHVIRGKRSGPTLLLTAAIHGDEINGTEIIRRVLATKQLERLRGTLVAVPVVNVYGFIAQSRYLPDRRDLNRSFPGSDRGSMASRLADLIMTELCDQCTHVIDLHTAAVGRDNLPHLRYDFELNEETDAMGRAFSPPVILNSQPAEGTFRHALGGKPMLLYEAGEALRFDEVAIRAGTKGILNVMRHLDMLSRSRARQTRTATLITNDSGWLRAPQSGILRTGVNLGAIVEEGQRLGIVADPFGEQQEEVLAHRAGIVIGKTNLPLVHEGEALFHLADFETRQRAEQAFEEFTEEYSDLD